MAIPKALQLAGLSVADIGIFEINEAFASQVGGGGGGGGVIDATQATYCVKTLGIPKAKLNPKGRTSPPPQSLTRTGGAIALGHPLGCTGSRQVRGVMCNALRQAWQIATLLPELQRQGAKYGVVSMCIGACSVCHVARPTRTGTGMGAAAVIERV